MEFQGDGNVVSYYADAPQWTSQTGGSGTTVVSMNPVTWIQILDCSESVIGIRPALTEKTESGQVMTEPPTLTQIRMVLGLELAVAQRFTFKLPTAATQVEAPVRHWIRP